MAKQIDNKQWSVEVLIKMVNNKEIIKPSFHIYSNEPPRNLSTK
jgi:hypothetical protein